MHYTNYKTYIGTADDTTSDMNVDDVNEKSKVTNEVTSSETSGHNEATEQNADDVAAVMEAGAVAEVGRRFFTEIDSEDTDKEMKEAPHEVIHAEDVQNLRVSVEVEMSGENVENMTAVEMSDGDEGDQDMMSQRVNDNDMNQPPQDAKVGKCLDHVQEDVGNQVSTEQTGQTGTAEPAPVIVRERLVLRIPKRQRIADAEDIQKEEHEVENEARVKTKRARRSSSGLPRVSTWSLEVDKARPDVEDSDYADEEGEEDADDLQVETKKTRRKSSGRRRIVSNATVEPEGMEPTPQGGITGYAEDDYPPQRTSDGWETYETEFRCEPCQKLGIRCFRFRQPEKGRKRWSCFRCHKRKKQCSFNDRRSSAKPSQRGRKKERKEMSKQPVDDDEDIEETEDIEKAGKGKEKQKAQFKRKGTEDPKTKRQSSTKPGQKSRQKQKATTPGESEGKVKEEDVEWQTGIFHTSLLPF